VRLAQQHCQQYKPNAVPGWSPDMRLTIATWIQCSLRSTLGTSTQPANEIDDHHDEQDRPDKPQAPA
jgi:hypothetical protein